MSLAIPRRARRALLAAAVPAVFAATALPAAADASTVRVSGGQLQYTAAAGESQRPARRLHRHAHPHPRQRPDHRRRRLRDRRHAAPRSACRAAPRPATRSATGATSCATSRRTPPASTWAPTTTRTSARLRDDSIGTNGLVVQDADVIGGTGNDLVTYRSAQGGVTRHPRRAVQRRQPRPGEHPARLRAHRGLERQRHDHRQQRPEQDRAATPVASATTRSTVSTARTSSTRAALPSGADTFQRPVRHRPHQLRPAGRPPSRSTWRASSATAARPVRATSSTRTPTTRSAAPPATR